MKEYQRTSSHDNESQRVTSAQSPEPSSQKDVSSRKGDENKKVKPGKHAERRDPR